MKKILLLLPLLCLCLRVTAQKTDKFLKKILYKNKELRPILDDAQKYRLQVLYTPVINGKPGNTYAFRHTPEEYFYPASTIKLPAVLLALEKLNIKGLAKESPLRIYSPWKEYSSAYSDSSSLSKLASVGHYAKKILLVSDNDAYNRLYDFLGPKYFNETMLAKQYEGFAANHRLSIFLPAKLNQSKPAIAMGELKPLPKLPYYAEPARMEVSQVLNTYSEPLALEEFAYVKKTPVKIGKGFYRNGELVSKPMDFTDKNHYPLAAQHKTLKSLFFPTTVTEASRFILSDDYLSFAKKYMSLLPRESYSPKYKPEKYYDGYAKFFLYGDTKARIPEHIKIYNKIGQAYGFLIDNAYIHDSKHKVSFLLSAVVYVNEDNILNDNKYEYETVGIPFLAALGRTLLNYEIKKRGKGN